MTLTRLQLKKILNYLESDLEDFNIGKTDMNVKELMELNDLKEIIRVEYIRETIKYSESVTDCN